MANNWSSNADNWPPFHSAEEPTWNIFLVIDSRLGYFKHTLPFYDKSVWVAPRSQSVVKKKKKWSWLASLWAVKNNRSITMIPMTLFTVLLFVYTLRISKGKLLLLIAGQLGKLKEWSGIYSAVRECKDSDTFLMSWLWLMSLLTFSWGDVFPHQMNIVGISYNFIVHQL